MSFNQTQLLEGLERGDPSVRAYLVQHYHPHTIQLFTRQNGNPAEVPAYLDRIVRKLTSIYPWIEDQIRTFPGLDALCRTLIERHYKRPLYTDAEIVRGMEEEVRTIMLYVLNHFREDVRAIVRKNNGSIQDADVLIDDVFMIVLGKIQNGQYRDLGKFGGYFLQIARNQWMRVLRDRKKDNTLPLDDQLYKLPDPAAEENNRRQLRDVNLDHLERAVAALDPECQRILRAFYFDSMSLKEYAERYEKSYDAVRQKIKKCRDRIWKFWQDNPPPEPPE